MQKWIEQIKWIASKSWAQFLLVSAAVWLIFVHLQVNRYLKDMITGLHYWRKSDTYAQIANYYYNGLHFFDHSIYYNQLETGGKAVAEFPLFYYFIAFQQTLFGNSPLIAKINWIVMLFLGVFCIFKIAHHFFNHFAVALLIALVLFLSPVFTFYMVDYLPDPIALNLVFIGLWLLLKSTINQKKSTLIFALTVLSIGGMIKPFFFIPFLAFLVVVIVNKRWLKQAQLKWKWGYLIPLAMVGLWFIYTNWYNSSINTNYFLSKPRPIWNYSAAEISQTWNIIQTHRLSTYMLPALLSVFLVLILINLCWWTKKTTVLNFYYVFSFLGSLAFIALFFNMFQDHDYYIYPLLFMLPLTLGSILYKIHKTVDKPLLLSIAAPVLLIAFVFALSPIWEVNQQRRKAPHITSKYLFENYQNTDYFLTKNGVEKNDLVIAFSDKSANFALSLMNRKGWSGFQTMTYHTNLTEYIQRGAAYLIINERVPNYYDSTAIHGFLNYPIADTNDLILYDLQPYQQ